VAILFRVKTLILLAIRCSFVFTAAAAFSLAHPASANLITNPGFETGNFTGWTLAGFGNVGVDSSNPHSGSYAAFFGEGSPIVKQIVNTVPGATYTVSFWLANTSVTSNGFGVVWSGETLLDLLHPDRFGYTLFTFSGVRATGFTETLLFNGTAPEGFWYLDDVSVIQSGSVPESFSTLWLALPFAGMVAFRRFRTKKG
jgi:hypothetical protein